MKALLRRTSLILSDRATNKNKYYIAEVEKDGNYFNVHLKYGRLGRLPQKSTKTFVNQHKAIEFYIKKVNEKMAKNYEEVPIEDIMFNEGEFYN